MTPGSGRSPGKGIGYPLVFLVFPCGSAGKETVSNAGDLSLILGLGRSPGEGKATHSSILVWRIPWTIQCMGSQRVRHDWVTFIFTIMGLKTYSEKSWYSGNIMDSGLLKTAFKSQFLPVLPVIKFLSLDIIIRKQEIFLT